MAKGSFLGNKATTAVCEPAAAARWLSMGVHLDRNDVCRSSLWYLRGAAA